jgi:hypothetical protein
MLLPYVTAVWYCRIFDRIRTAVLKKKILFVLFVLSVLVKFQCDSVSMCEFWRRKSASVAKIRSLKVVQ